MKLRLRETGAEFEASGGAVLGRASDCQIVLNDASVSRRHARLEDRAGRLWVVDLGSSNGTRLNGRRSAEFEVRPGDLVTIGGVALDVVGEAPVPEPAVTRDEVVIQETAAPRAASADDGVEARRARLRAQLQNERRARGLGDLGQQPLSVRALVVLLGLGLLAGVFYGVRFLGEMIAPR